MHYSTWFAEQEELAQETRGSSQVRSTSIDEDMVTAGRDIDVELMGEVLEPERGPGDFDFDLRIVAMANRMSLYDVEDCHRRSSGNDQTTVVAALSQQRKTGLVDPERLATMWGIGVHSAQKTLEATTQTAIWLTAGPIH